MLCEYSLAHKYMLQSIIKSDGWLILMAVLISYKLSQYVSFKPLENQLEMNTSILNRLFSSFCSGLRVS